MGNKTSSNDGNLYHHNQDEATSHTYQSKNSDMSLLQGSNASTGCGANPNHNGWIDASAARAGTGDGQLTPITIEDDSESDVYEVPPPSTRLPKEPQHACRHNSATVSEGRSVKDQFDFNNSSQPLPWSDTRHGGGIQVSFL